MMDLMRPSYRSALPLRDAFDRLFEGAFTPVFGEGTASAATIPTNVWETGDGYQVALLVPGVDPESVELTALGNTITVSGSLAVNQPEGARAIWQEFGPSRFRRQIGLPSDLDSEKVQAAYRNGVLLLTVPKAEHAKPRQIKIQSS
ncbi:MAG: Hsp20/alpha crystallin family protein [Chloroflexota bacterium]|nr:Hsp20/alpha crystallin family protein [Chloroflexota bacterium]